MKTFRVPLFLLLITGLVRAQEAAPPAAADPATGTNPATGTIVSVQRTPEELEQLLAPIALYPDALIALILPASTVPTDIVLAARHLRDNPGDRAQIEHRAWDESVKSLTNYPEVLKWMDENLHWTRQVGEAFAAQPADVMQTVQRLRAKARAAGTLVDSPQQQVIAEQQVIRIVPAQPDIIYVPHYEPEVVFVDRPVYYTHPFLTFGVGVPVGSWLAFDCDWRHNSIWVGNRHRRWTGHDWRRPLVPFAHSHHSVAYNYSSHRNVHTPEARQWRPPTNVSRITVTASNRFRSEVVRPVPLGLPTSRSHTFRDSGASRSFSSRDSSRDSVRDSGPSRFRGSSSVTRAPGVENPPVVPAMPRNFTPGFRQEAAGPRLSSPAVLPPLPTARLNSATSAPTPSVNVQPTPSPRHRGGGDGIRDYGNRSRSDSDGVRDYGNRSRSYRSSQPTVTAPLPVAPAIPMTTPQRSAQPAGPRVDNSFSRRASAPQVVPAMPIHNRSSRPAAVGPVAPQVAPQAASEPAAPQAAPVQQRSGGESRGHRGSVRRPSS